MSGYAIICLLLALAFAPPARAVDTLRVTSPDPVPESWRWTEFDRSSGLSGGVRDIYEDRDGNIWFATDEGAQRYDGLRWKTYTPEEGLAHNEVRAVIQARDGAMWFGTRGGGISRFDPAAGQAAWTTYTTADGLPTNYIDWRGLHQARDGALWAGFTNQGFADTTGTLGGIARFDGQVWTPVDVPEGPPRPSIRDIHQATDGSLWFATGGHGVLRFDGRRWTRYTAGDGLAGNGVFQIYETGDGALWFACLRNGISRFDGKGWRTYTSRDGLPDGAFISLWQTGDGTLMAGNGGGVLCRFDGSRWQAYSREETSQLNGAVFAQLTRNGMVWFWEWMQVRAFRFDAKGAWAVYTHPEGLFGGFEVADGSVWFHTSRSAVRLKNGLWTAYTPSDGFMDGEVFGLHPASGGGLWFVGTHRGEPAVTQWDGEGWRIYTVQDGLIDRIHQPHPSSTGIARDFHSPMLETRDGTVWFMGQHAGRAAVCRFDGQKWTRYTEADGLVGQWMVLGYEATDGTLWFGTYRPNSDQGDGLFRFDGKIWKRYTEADGLSSAYITGIAEWPAGTLWVGTVVGISRMDLSAPPGEQTWWNKVDFPVARAKIRQFLPTEDALWFGFHPNRGAGAGRYDGQNWRIYTEADGLVGNTVNSLIRASDGALYFVSRSGISWLKGGRWARYTGENSPLLLGQYPVIHEGRNFWIDSSDGKIIHFRHDTGGRAVPETFLEPAADRISSAGNIFLRWLGRDLWDGTPPRDLRFQWRMDNQDWSSESRRTDITFTELSPGSHRFEIRSIDREGNIDPTPVVHAFIVEVPWWRNPYVLVSVAVLVGLVVVQTGRLVKRDRGLRASNAALSEANKDLYEANQALQRERAAERIRGQVQAMERAEDFEGILSLLSEDLKTAGLSFHTCGIDVLDEPVDAPTMAYFESHGFRYTTYTIDPEGAVTCEPYHVQAPFPEVIRETVERFQEGKPWRGSSEERTILEVPVSNYGRLRITAPERAPYVEEEILTLQEFAGAIALGYARYLDIREIQAQTERKSAFLASMSHELRTPMNAIIGFTRMVLRRSGDVLPERQKENLNKVTESANHLLGLINGLLDLSRIEAGRVDVDAKPFSVMNLIRSCCGVVEPLVKSGVKLNYEVSEDVGEAHTDEDKLRHVLGNLLGNAVKFTEEGEIAVRARTVHDQLLISVSDTGIGMPQEALETIFDEFQQVRGSDKQHKGTGLGLAITKRYAELLGGTVSVESVVGKGSVFTVRVPLVYSQAGTQ